MTPIKGVDLSVYQGIKGTAYKVFAAFKKQGIQFGVFRASLGNSYRDPSFPENRARGEKNDMVVGAYHFLLHGNAAAQAENYVGHVKSTGGFGNLLAVVDVEWASTRDSSPRWKDVVDFIHRFRELVPNHPIGIYTAAGYWTSSFIGNKDGSELADFLWQARWIDGDPLKDITLPPAPPRAGFGGWTTTPLWQWGAIHFNGKIYDGNAWYGTLDELKKLTAVPKTPIKDRPNYRLGYNAVIQEAIVALPSMQVPAGPPGPAYPLGVSDARDDLQAALTDLVIKE